nr:hypothetical protein [Pseudomonadota bacterium]
LSSKLTPAEAKSQATAKLQEISRSIATQVEKLKNIPSKQEQSAVASILDPVTLKVAKRLLSQGQEIHRVARKLELPISQVRELDRMMRNIALTSEDAETPYPAIEVVPASKIVRSKETKVEENFAPLVTAEEKVNFTDIELSRENDEKTISNFFF